MRKSVVAILIMAIIFSTFSPTLAKEIEKVETKYPIRVVVNGGRITFPDAQPYLDKNERTQVPVRFVSEALGGKVTWDEKTKTVTIKRYTDTITLAIGKKEINVNGEIKSLDTEAVLVESRTFVPVRFVSEAMGADVTWDQDVLTVYISIEKDKASKDKKEPGELIEHKGGFLVPSESKLIVSNSDSELTEQSFLISFLKSDVSQQMIDLRNAIESKFGEKIASEVYEHISKKKVEEAYLEEKQIYVKEFDQYILIAQSDGGTRSIPIYIYHPGIDPENPNI